MKEVKYKGITVEIDFIGEELEYDLFPKLSKFFRFESDNIFLLALGIDVKTFNEDEHGFIDFPHGSPIKEVLCDGVPCNHLTHIYLFSIKDKKRVRLEIHTDRLYFYELAIKDPPMEPKRGKAFAGDEVELVVYGPFAGLGIGYLQATNKETQEKFLIELTRIDFPPNYFTFIMPKCDIVLSLMERKD